ncbi:MAG: protein-L-isoaspartate(D-aspartate) O-methyltransferase [Bradymonadaceae bacterium]
MDEGDEFRAEREKMVERQIAGRDVSDPAVLDAMRAVRRHAFVPEGRRSMAYSDRPLPIGEGQTISQPYIVAMMTEALALSEDDRVLEVGTGSGYGAAVLAEVAGEVYTIERYEDLAEAAQSRLERLGYDNVEVVVGDGTKGLPERAPFDGIVATASGPDVPETFKEQLAPGGRIVMPVGRKSGGQRLVKVVRTGDGSFEEEDLGFVRFVPLVGEEGWSGEESTGASKPGSGGLFDF